MDLMLAAKAQYDRWCTAHKGHNPDGSPMRCWEALSGAERATWTAVAETAYHHVLKHLDALPAQKPETAIMHFGWLGTARVDLTVTCGAEVHRMSYEQALVDISCQPARQGTPDVLQLVLTGKRVSTPAT